MVKQFIKLNKEKEEDTQNFLIVQEGARMNRAVSIEDLEKRKKVLEDSLVEINENIVELNKL